MFILHHSFRYGKGLADILGEYVYTKEFRGNPDAKTDIIVLNAPKVSPPAAHSSMEEKEAILKYVKGYLADKDYAVLTPYKDQKALLSMTLQHDDIYTIHGSQGREWDTVIISMVSDKPDGFLDVRLMNTAVSRARKRLIICCDADRWKNFEKHLIGGIVKRACS
jgi:superfamily I DNA and/or RNA helicase